MNLFKWKGRVINLPMSFFNNLEKKIEKLIENTFLGGFSGQVQPTEIAREIWLEITSHKEVKGKHTYVPNFFELSLSCDEHGKLESILPTIESEILDYIRQESKNRDFAFKGPLAIQWNADDTVKKGFFRTVVHFTRLRELPQEIRIKVDTKQDEPALIERTTEAAMYRSPGAIPETPVLRRRLERRTGKVIIKPPPPKEDDTLIKDLTAVLTVINGFDKGQAFQLTEREYRIGRSETCDIVIGDPKVSRQHARLFREGNGYILEDTGSKTGIEVNGSKVERISLTPEDTIQIGHTTLKFLRLFA